MTKALRRQKRALYVQQSLYGAQEIPQSQNSSGNLTSLILLPGHELCFREHIPVVLLVVEEPLDVEEAAMERRNEEEVVLLEGELGGDRIRNGDEIEGKLCNPTHKSLLLL
jgi:hypothetical protein